MPARSMPEAAQGGPRYEPIGDAIEHGSLTTAASDLLEVHQARAELAEIGRKDDPPEPR
jgi:hypothetical protein